MVNNVRFPVRGVAQRPNLASKALAHSVKALVQDGIVGPNIWAPQDHDFPDAGSCILLMGWRAACPVESGIRIPASPYTKGVTPGFGMGEGVKEESHFRSSGARSSLLLITWSQVMRLPV